MLDKSPKNVQSGASGAAADAGCAVVALDLALFADGALDAVVARTVADHVAQCAACAEELLALRQLIGQLQASDKAALPAHDAAFWAALQADIVAAVADHAPAKPQLAPVAKPVVQRWWQRPRTRWAGALAVAAALLAVLAGPVQQAVQATKPVQEPVDAKALLGSAKEAVASDRAFVDDLAASEDDPADMLDELDDLDDVDLDALGTALDDEATAGQGA